MVRIIPSLREQRLMALILAAFVSSSAAYAYLYRMGWDTGDIVALLS